MYGPGGTLRYCIGHAPGAQDARRKGGHAASRAERAGKLLPARLQPMVSLLGDALGEVHRGELDPRAASAMVSLAAAWCAGKSRDSCGSAQNMWVTVVLGT